MSDSDDDVAMRRVCVYLVLLNLWGPNQFFLLLWRPSHGPHNEIGHFTIFEKKNK